MHPIIPASLLLSFIPIVLARECHPILNELGSLRFTTSTKEQYFELALNDACSNNSQINLNEYGLLVLNTKSRRVGKPDHFNTITFVDFNNHKWPRHEGKLAKYFVVGSSPVKSASYNWNFYNNAEKNAKCSRFVNWPQCLVHPIDPNQRSVIDPFFTSPATPLQGDQTPQTAFALVHLPDRRAAKQFATYFSLIETTSSRNVVYRRTKLDVSTDNQMWLGKKIKHIVVFSPTDDPSQMLPMLRLTQLFGSSAKIVAQYLRPDAINDVISVSLCGSRWALSMRSPGSDNHCEGEKFKGLLPEIFMSSLRPSIPCTADVRAVSVDVHAPGDDFHMDTNDFQSEDRHISSTSSPHQQQVCAGHWDTIVSWMRILDSKIGDIAQCVNEISSGLKERNILYEEGIELGTEEKRKEFGLHRDFDERERFKKDLALLEIDGHKLTYKQKGMLTNMAWVSYYRDPSRPNADFIRCKLCNRDHVSPYDPSADHDACEAVDVQAERNERKRKQPGEGSRVLDINLLGASHVLCLKRYRDLSTPTKAIGISRLMESILRHEKKSTEHKHNFDEFVLAIRNLDRSLTPEDMAATVTSTLTAYTIAKEGLPFAKQFPLVLMAMKSGAVSATAHYEATTAQRMVKQFALHMKFDMLNYIISNDLPFSLLADGTSNDGVKWIVFLIRTLSPANRPITFHFSLVEVESETANDIVDAFSRVLQSYDPWARPSGLWMEPYNFAMRKLVALSSDGASVMTGSVNGVHEKLKQLLSNSQSQRSDLLLSICSAHKLNLAVTSLSTYGVKLAQAAIMEMHHLFGSNLRTKGRVFYHRAAHDMGFHPLHMDKLHKVRWSASLQNALSKVLRMYPVLIEALDRMAADRTLAENMRQRAEVAVWVLKDPRNFIILHHVSAGLHHLTKISEALQKEESLLVDHLTRWRHLSFLLENDQIKHDAYQNLHQERTLGVQNAINGQILEFCSFDYLKECCSLLLAIKTSTPRINVVYFPKRFKDFNKHKELEKMEPAEREATEEARTIKQFRDIVNFEKGHLQKQPDLNVDLELHSEDAPDFDIDQLARLALGKVYVHGMNDKKAGQHIDAFYDDVKNALFQYMTPGRRQSEAGPDFSYALDRHIILDIIECGGDFEQFATCVPASATRENRGYPAYFDETDTINPQIRKDLILRSIKSVEKYCNLPPAQEEFLTFYDNIAKDVERLSSWPTDLRQDTDSVRLYQTLLNNADKIMLPDSVTEAIKCILVIPASNADPERSFSTANRLSRGERSNLWTETLDHLMTVERDGPSVLTVKPMKLARQWLNPRGVLDLPKGKPSTFQKDSSLMKQIKGSLSKGNSRALVELDVKQYMIANGLNNRADSDDIRRSREDIETSRASIFSNGVLHGQEET